MFLSQRVMNAEQGLRPAARQTDHSLVCSFYALPSYLDRLWADAEVVSLWGVQNSQQGVEQRLVSEPKHSGAYPGRRVMKE